MNREHKGTLYMLGCVVLWSTSGFLLEFIPWNSMLIAGARAVPAALTIHLYMRIRKIPFQLDRSVLKIAAAMCLTCVLFVIAAKLSTVVNVAALQQTSPVFLMLISAGLFHKRFHKSDVVVVLCILLGVVLFFCDRFDPGYVLGNLLAVFTGFTCALMFVFMGDGASDARRLSATLLSDILSVAICLPFSFSEPAVFTKLSVLMALLLGVFQLGISYILLSLASEDCPPLTCSLLSTMAPLLNAMWMWLFFRQKPSPLAFAGIVVILGTIILWNLYKERKRKKLAVTEGETL